MRIYPKSNKYASGASLWSIQKLRVKGKQVRILYDLVTVL